MKNEPTFEKACQQWPDMENIWTPVGWPDHIHNFNILWNGNILARPDNNRRCPGKLKNQGVQVSIWPAWQDWIVFYQGGWMQDDNSAKQGWNDGPAPVLWTQWAWDGVVKRSEVFAYIPGGRTSKTGDEPMFAWVRMSVVDIFAQPPLAETTGFNVLIEKPHLTAGMMRRGNVMFNPDTRYPRKLRGSAKNYSRRDGFCVLEKGGKVRLGIAPGQDCALTFSAPSAKQTEYSLGMRPWHQMHISLDNKIGASVDMLIPIAPVDKKLFQEIARAGYDAALKQTTRFWRRTLKPSCLTLPEQPLNDAIDNSIRFSHMLTERDPKTATRCKVNGSWIYNDLWATPGAMDTAMLMDTLGYHDFIEPYLEPFKAEQGTAVPPGLRHYWGDKETPGAAKGIFEQHPGYLAPPRKYRTIDWITDNGAVLYALSMHGLLSGNKSYIDRFSDCIVKSCEWIRDARTLTGHGGYEGVLPPAVNSDSGTVVQGVWGVGWNYLGLAKAVKLLKRIGHPQAGQFDAERRAYKKAFVAALRDKVSKMPTWRDKRGRERRLVPAALVGDQAGATNRAFYLDAGALFLVLAGLMRANDPIMKDCLAWFREGPQVAAFRPESGCWQAPVLVHEMSSCEPCYSWNLFHSLQSGDKPRFLEGLYSLYAGSLSRQTWISCETRGGVTGTVFSAPLATYLTRLCLLDDTWRDDELHLLRMSPERWLEHPGLNLVRIPTEHGPVTLQAAISKNGGKLDIRYKPEFFAPPRKVVLHVPQVDGVKEIRLNGKLIKGKSIVL